MMRPRFCNNCGSMLFDFTESLYVCAECEESLQQIEL